MHPFHVLDDKHGLVLIVVGSVENRFFANNFLAGNHLGTAIRQDMISNLYDFRSASIVTSELEFLSLVIIFQ